MDSPPRIDFLTDLILRDVKGSNTQLGEGIYGKVFEVEYTGANFAAQHFQPDVLEVIKRNEDFFQACHIWSKADRHPNIVRLMGMWYRDCDNSSFPVIVTEKMRYNLRSLIQSRDDAVKIDFHQKMLILRDVSNGLWYLHSQNPAIVHYGLTPSNILLGCSQSCMIAKITNVGVAKVIKIPDNTFDSGFLPPEAASNDPQYEPPFDIFGFGMVFWYVAVNSTLPKDCNPKKLNAEFQELQKNLNMLKAGDSANLKVLLKTCWDKTPDNRTSIVKFSEAIKDLIRSKHTAQENRRLRCHDPADIVDIALGESDIEAKQPITIPELYKNTFSKVPNEKALCWKGSDGQWQSITYGDYERLIYNVAKSFRKLGLEPYHAVGILGFNSVEWFASSIGAVFAGGLSTGIHATSSPEICHYILKDCKANIVVLENGKLLDTIMEIRDKLPHLKAIVQYKGELNKNYPDTYTWTKFLELGKDMEDSVIDEIINNQRPNQCAIVLYTSGTTGHPKGVMLSHDNLTWSTSAFLDTIGLEGATKTAISYLSSAHIIGTFADMFLPIPVGGTVCFATSNAIESSLISAMEEVHPTFLFSTPRVWEMIKQKVESILIEHQNTSQGAKGMSSSDAIKLLGLEKCKYISVGGEQMHKETLKYFHDMKLTVLGYYGMSESTLPQTTNLEGAKKFGSCGCSAKGVQVEVYNKDEYEELQLLHFNKQKNDIGEVVCRGRNVFMGYLGMEEKTRETINNEGWLHSGDIGWLDNDNFLHIICRIDDLITMAGGQRVVPIEIEEHIKSEVEFLSNVVLIGDNRKQLTCLLTLKCVVDPVTGEATDDLQPQVIKIFKEELGTDCTTVSQVVNTKDQKVLMTIQNGIDRYNKNYTCSDIQKIHRWRLLPTDFTVSGGELVRNHEVCALKEAVSVSERCTNYGKVIEIEQHNVTVTVPQGAIEKGYSVEVEVAVSLFGPHKLPKDYIRISSYVWIGASYSFKKPLKIEIEHHAVVVKNADISLLCVMEARKENGTDPHTDEDKMCEATEVYSSDCETGSSFYTYHTHSKLTCLAKKSVNIADEVAVYQFLPKNYAELENFTVEICFCCNLKFLRKLIDDMYKKQDMVRDDHSSSIVRIVHDQELQLRLHLKEVDDWNVSYLGRNKIHASEIVCLRFQDNHSITREADKHHYPPCFKVKVNRRNPQAKLDTNFEICVQSEEVLSTLNLLVPAANSHDHEQPQSEQSSTACHPPVPHVSSEQSSGEILELTPRTDHRRYIGLQENHNSRVPEEEET
ncbi:uncharacterized protein [Dysidea avara]|uniref:uncharacterized protein isoform X2 n=1 Tax=Dysidea avara TaxID=196820 RepID=UPI00331F4EAE